MTRHDASKLGHFQPRPAGPRSEAAQRAYDEARKQAPAWEAVEDALFGTGTCTPDRLIPPAPPAFPALSERDRELMLQFGLCPDDSRDVSRWLSTSVDLADPLAEYGPRVFPPRIGGRVASYLVLDDLTDDPIDPEAESKRLAFARWYEGLWTGDINRRG